MTQQKFKAFFLNCLGFEVAPQHCQKFLSVSSKWSSNTKMKDLFLSVSGKWWPNMKMYDVLFVS